MWLLTRQFVGSIPTRENENFIFLFPRSGNEAKRALSSAAKNAMPPKFCESVLMETEFKNTWKPSPRPANYAVF